MALDFVEGSIPLRLSSTLRLRVTLLQVVRLEVMCLGLFCFRHFEDFAPDFMYCYHCFMYWLGQCFIGWAVLIQALIICVRGCFK